MRLWQALLRWLDGLIAGVLQGLGMLRSQPRPPSPAESPVALPPASATPPAPPTDTLSLWDRFWQRLFAINQRTSTMRLIGCIVLTLLCWGGLAWWTGPDISWKPGMPPAVLLGTLRALFSAQVWRVLLILAAMALAAYRWAALYLDDIYELYDVPVAAHFIRQAAFALSYEVIEIKDGDVAPEYRSSPVVRIGGPGRVVVHVENAAVFEKVDGTPHEIGPTVAVQRPGWLARLRRRHTSVATDGSVLLEGFERLRAVVSLLPHQTTINMRTRTREGVPVRVENVTAIYHVARGRQDSTLQHPYPFLPNALINLVYSQEPPRESGSRAVQHRGWVRLAERRLLRGTLSRLIAQRSLSEFLTSTGELEDDVLQEVRQEIQQQMATFAETQAPLFPPPETTGVTTRPADFLNRERIRERILAQAQQQIQRLGVTVSWSGSGTWQTPPEISVENHLKAWRISLRNQIRGSQEALEQLREHERVGYILKLLREGPLQAYRQARQSMWAEERQVEEMLYEYLHQLRPVVDRLRRRGTVEGHAALLRAVDYLEILLREPPAWEWGGRPEETP